MLVAACSSSSKTSTSGNTTAPQGGTLTIGAEQEPDCMDWTDQCAGSSWGYWMANVTTLPSAMTPVKQSDGTYQYEPSQLLTGAPTVQTSPKEVVTYHINPKAVWNDGTPVTSADFQYTWDHIAHGKSIYDPTGYNRIASVDDSDPATAVVTYAQTYSCWQCLFGGGYGILPSHLLKGKNQDAIMKDGYTFSAGPWEMPAGGWKKGVSITLVPNPKWWGSDKAHLDKVIFQFVQDTAAEFQAFKSNQLKMIYPQPQLDVVSQLSAGSIPNSHSIYNADTGSYESFWMNMQAPPLNDLKVRQAIAYSIDRDQIVNTLFGKLGVHTALNVINAPVLSKYSNTSAFAQYTKDTSKAESLLTSDGYTKGSDGYYAKDGKTLEVTIKTTAKNQRREETEAIMQKDLQAVGIKLTIANQSAADLFGKTLPGGTFEMALYAQQITAYDPGRCNIFCSVNIPTTANGNVGNNWTRTNASGLDSLLQTVDSTTDENTRVSSNKQADDITASQMVTLPLDPLPDILLWNTAVVGPIQDNAVLGPWFNLQDWGLKS
jgi:peptide/nickel transport system substrate-binding protein